MRLNTVARLEMFALSGQSKRELNAILDRNAEALAEQRSAAAASIRADIRRLKPSLAGSTGEQLLHQVRYSRHGI